jgi:hypothetical protein
MILEFQSEKRTIYVAILYKDGKIVKIGRDRKPKRAPDVYVPGFGHSLYLHTAYFFLNAMIEKKKVQLLFTTLFVEISLTIET